MMSKRLRRFGFVLATGVVAGGCADEMPTRSPATPDDPSASTYVNTHTVLGSGGSLYGISNTGIMVGFHIVSGAPRAFAYGSSFGGHTLTTLNAGTKVVAPVDTAFNVNSHGQIVGTSNNTAGLSRPVLWNSVTAAPVDLGTIGRGYALDINMHGMVVGWSSSSGIVRAFTWTSGGGLQDPLGGLSGKAYAVSDNGVVVGEVTYLGQLRAFRWTSAGGLQVLGTLGGAWSAAYDVSSSGRIVGASATSVGHTHAFIWYPGDRMDDLGTLGGTESVATTVTDAAVAGYSTTSAGVRHGFAYRATTRTIRDQGTGGGTEATIRALNGYGVAVGHATTTGATSRVYWQLTDVNTNPVVFFNAHPGTVQEGTTVVFNYTAVDDEDALRYYWTFGYGGLLYFDYTAPPPPISRLYNEDQGVFPVRVTVSDPTGFTDSDSTVITVLNRAPTGTFIVPAGPIFDRSAFQLSVTDIADAAADMRAGIQVSFDCGNGIWSAYSSHISMRTRACASAGDVTTIIVGVRLRDKDGGVREYTAPINFPVVSLNAVGSTTITLGQQFTARGSFTDAAPAYAPYSFSFNWGDGRVTTGVLNAAGAVPPVQHRFITAGYHTVTLSVTDSDGKTGVSPIMYVAVSP